MKLNLRSGFVLLAVAMHLAVPVAAYAKAPVPALPGDFCSTLRTGPMTPAGGGIPSPASDEHHCAHAPCCTGGASNAAAPPPPVPVVLRFTLAGVGTPESTPVAAPLAVIIAAQPRGPPQRT